MIEPRRGGHVSRTVLECGHSKDTTEDTLIVAIEKTTETGEASNSKDLEVLQQS